MGDADSGQVSWGRLSEHLDRLMDAMPEERAALLLELAKTAPDVAAAARDFLQKESSLQADGFLNGLPALAVQLPAAPAFVAGTRIGAYTLERPLGRGGMGEVWLASRADGRFEGQCAVKILNRSLGHPDTLRRFQREGRLLWRLAHPHIARLLDAGALEDNHPYLALEYVEGERIDRYCDLHSLDVAARVRLFLDVISAVAHAHSHLIVHRDLKPSNVLVTADGAVKLLDFGIAKLLQADASDDETTRIEDAALTPEYAAPEQLLGEAPSTATDVYQLGVLLYVLLAGSHPLKLSGTRAERIRAALDGQLPRASDFAPQPLRQSLRGDLDAILSQALRREVRERYPTATALGEDLERYLQQQPVKARSGNVWYRTRRFAVRNKFPVAALLVAALAIICGSGLSIWQASIAAQERDRALSLASRSDETSDFLERMITEGVAADEPLTVRQILERSERLVMSSPASTRENQAAILSVIAGRYSILETTPRAAETYARALAVLGDSPDIELRSEIICHRAKELAYLGRVAQASATIDHQLDTLKATHREQQACLLDRAYVAHEAGDKEGTLRYATAALRSFYASRRRSVRDEGIFLNEVGQGYADMDDLLNASDYFRRALDKYAKAGRARSNSAEIVRTSLAIAINQGGAPKEAIALYDQTIQFATERDPHGALPSTQFFNRARALESYGLYVRAQTDYQRALDIDIKNEASAGDRIMDLLGLASVASAFGRLAEAEALLTTAESTLSAIKTPQAKLSRRVALMRGGVSLARGKADEALSTFGKAVIANDRSSATFEALLGIAAAQLLSSDANSAEASARAALEVAKKLQGSLPYSNHTGRAQLALGKALEQRDHRDEAVRAYQSAVAHLSNTVDPNHPALLQAQARMKALE